MASSAPRRSRAPPFGEVPEGEDSASGACAARACLDLLAGASYMTRRHAKEVVARLRGLGGDLRAQAEEELAGLEALVHCLQEIITQSSSAGEDVVSAERYGVGIKRLPQS